MAVFYYIQSAVIPSRAHAYDPYLRLYGMGLLSGAVRCSRRSGGRQDLSFSGDQRGVSRPARGLHAAARDEDAAGATHIGHPRGNSRTSVWGCVWVWQLAWVWQWVWVWQGVFHTVCAFFITRMRLGVIRALVLVLFVPLCLVLVLFSAVALFVRLVHTRR